ncbi:MarR family winged helix-turn-helix transcriptional regulator [Amphritea pacifica]|nr:MarR family transcriptional regulator [Amphritea pacifica]
MEKTLKPLGMDIARWRVAVLLSLYGTLSISDIAEHAIGKLPTMTKIVYRMRDAGLVEVNASETDGRVTVVSLTDEGHDKVKMVLKTTEKKVFAKAFKGFTEPQIKKSTELLRRYFINMSAE